MSDTIVVLVNGEVLAGGYESSINDQKSRADDLARELLPILASNLNIAIMHGNKPQVGYVLFRSELASHVLHPIPLDVCGADTQGATGYMLCQSFLNELKRSKTQRYVMSVITQTLVNSDSKFFVEFNKQIGPWLDQERAKQRSQVFGWQIVEEPGYGFRRVVSSPPPIEIIEMEGIKQLVESGMIVITAGGGGIPVCINNNGIIEGVEAVVDTDHVACLLARELNARIMLMIVENDVKFIHSGLGTEVFHELTLDELNRTIKESTIYSDMVRRKFQSAYEYLNSGGEQVVITTLDNLSSTLEKKSGLWISVKNSTSDLYKLIQF
ncbi:MAG: hypothetical protein ACK2U1_14840 [Anaerolineales bacterium]